MEDNIIAPIEEATNELVTSPNSTPVNIIPSKIPLALTAQESQILSGLAKMDVLSSISPYLTSIVLDGSTNSKDIGKIDDFIIDWQTENAGEELPKPLLFIQNVVLGRGLNKELANSPVTGLFQPQPQNIPQESIEIDPENIPTYLGKIYELIEREVRRRVKIEMKEYTVLSKKYEELKKKFESISQIFTVN